MQRVALSRLAASGDAVLVVLDVGTALATLHMTAFGKGLAVLLGDVTGAAEMLLGILVVDEELTVFAVAVGLVASNRNNVEDIGGLLEDDIHLLKRSVGGLGIEEVDDREDESVDNGEDDVGSVLDVLECHRGDHDNHEVENPGPC